MTKGQAEIAATILKATIEAMGQVPMSHEDHEQFLPVKAACDAAVAHLFGRKAVQNAITRALISIKVASDRNDRAEWPAYLKLYLQDLEDAADSLDGEMRRIADKAEGRA